MKMAVEKMTAAAGMMIHASIGFFFFLAIRKGRTRPTPVYSRSATTSMKMFGELAR